MIAHQVANAAQGGSVYYYTHEEYARQLYPTLREAVQSYVESRPDRKVDPVVHIYMHRRDRLSVHELTLVAYSVIVEVQAAFDARGWVRSPEPAEPIALVRARVLPDMQRALALLAKDMVGTSYFVGVVELAADEARDILAREP